MSLRNWTNFFQDAGISSSEAQTYTAAFVQHNIRNDTLEDLDKEDLRDIGITAIGDIKRILKFAKKDIFDKYRTTKKEQTLSNQIEGWMKAENVKSEQVNEDINNDQVTNEDDDNDSVMARVEADIPTWRSETKVASPIKERSNKCNKCSYSVSEYLKLRQHKDNAHGDSIVTKLDAIPLDEKEKNVTTITTDVCQNLESDKSSGNNNESSIIYEKDRVFVCEHCPYKTSRSDELKKHCNVMHIKLNSYQCKLCEYRTYWKDDIKKHETRMHTNTLEILSDDQKRKYKCNICDKSYKSQGNLTDHIKHAHLETKQYSCDACPYRSYNRTIVMQHKKIMHYKIKPYKCDQCQFSTSSNKKIRCHIKMVHHGIGKALVEAEESVKTNLTAWRDACTFTCRYCYKEISKRNDMIVHCKKVHGTSGGTKHYFMSEVVNHECLLCQKQIPRESRRLIDHMLKMHAFNLANYEGKHYFPSINAKRNNSADLPIENMIASGISPNNLRRLSWRDACIFACNSCSKETTNRYDMMLHCREEHGINGTKFHYSMLKRVNYLCLLCKKQVLHETDILNSHMVKIHSINLATYEEMHYFPSLVVEAGAKLEGRMDDIKEHSKQAMEIKSASKPEEELIDSDVQSL